MDGIRKCQYGAQQEFRGLLLHSFLTLNTANLHTAVHHLAQRRLIQPKASELLYSSHVMTYKAERNNAWLIKMKDGTG